MSDDTQDFTNTLARIEQKLVRDNLVPTGLTAHAYARQLCTLVQSLGEERVRKAEDAAKSALATAQVMTSKMQRIQDVVTSAVAFVDNDDGETVQRDLEHLERTVDTYKQHVTTNTN
jgi:hypothetical protein